MPDMLNNKINWARNQANYYITTNEVSIIPRILINSILIIENCDSIYLNVALIMIL